MTDVETPAERLARAERTLAKCRARQHTGLADIESLVHDIHELAGEPAALGASVNAARARFWTAEVKAKEYHVLPLLDPDSIAAEYYRAQGVLTFLEDQYVDGRDAVHAALAATVLVSPSGASASGPTEASGIAP